MSNAARAWRVHENGNPREVLRLEEVPSRARQAGEVTVRMQAAALNFADLLYCDGSYQERPEIPYTLGLEGAGIVEDVDDSSRLERGQLVIVDSAPPDGCFSQLVTARADRVYPVPQTMSPSEAAGFHLGFQTAHFALHRRAQLRVGETVLVHGAAGAVGSAATQLGVAAGARVVAVVGGSDKAEHCRELGAEVVIDHQDENFVDVIKQLTDGSGVDVVLDPIGGHVFEGSRRCVAFEGRIVVIGFAAGEIPRLPLNHLLVKNYSVLGLYWGSYRQHAPDLIEQTHEELVRLYKTGAIRPVIGAELPFTQVPDGLEMLRSRSVAGRVVVQVV